MSQENVEIVRPDDYLILGRGLTRHAPSERFAFLAVAGLADQP
jgi:hypothetical protein